MAIGRAIRRHDADPFTDLLFNALLGFVFMFMVALLFLNPPVKQGVINPKAEFIINVTWEDLRPDDVDVWVESPSGELLWFRSPEVGLMHLDRDDRCTENDMLTVDGITRVNPLNQEVVTIRGIVPGEYVVNLHYYKSQTKRAVPVTVRVAKINPSLEVIYYGTTVLQRVGEERTAVRFTVANDHSVSSTNTLPKQIVKHDLLH